MRIVNLIENTQGRAGCVYAHGLSFYVETEKHKLLMDVGPSEATLQNAEALGIDLSLVDTVVLSHGHYDHSGGILPFLKVNSRATIYLQANAGEDYYADDGAEQGNMRFRYIGIDKEILRYPNLSYVDGNAVLDEELSLFTVKNRTHALPSMNSRLLVKTKDGFQKDAFTHEHYLVIREGEKSVLISGCAHNGILSILDEYRILYGKDPDAVISGFHLMKKMADYTAVEIREIQDTAVELKNYKASLYTCHCTGVPAYEQMKAILGDQLHYVHSGEEVYLGKR